MLLPLDFYPPLAKAKAPIGIIAQPTFPADLTSDVNIVVIEVNLPLIIPEKLTKSCTNLSLLLIYSTMVCCMDRFVHRKGRFTFF